VDLNLKIDFRLDLILCDLECIATSASATQDVHLRPRFQEYSA
jgi:hypothetical protein